MIKEHVHYYFGIVDGSQLTQYVPTNLETKTCRGKHHVNVQWIPEGLQVFIVKFLIWFLKLNIFLYINGVQSDNLSLHIIMLIISGYNVI